MVEHFVGRVAELWRYPVKSMLGERRNQLQITPRGALGDRAWALRETATGRIASAKRFPQLLAFHARYEVEPTFAAPGRIQITLPDGRTICPDDPDASRIISDFFGHSMRLENQPASDEKTGIDRATVFGDVPVSQSRAAESVAPQSAVAAQCRHGKRNYREPTLDEGAARDGNIVAKRGRVRLVVAVPVGVVSAATGFHSNDDCSCRE